MPLTEIVAHGDEKPRVVPRTAICPSDTEIAWAIQPLAELQTQTLHKQKELHVA